MTAPLVYSLTAIVIRRRSVGEGDKILTLYTSKVGKKRAIAKGVRKVTSRRAPHLELFSEGTFTFHKGKTLDSITDAVSIHLYGNMCMTLEKIAMLYYVAEVINFSTVENDPHQDVFYLLSDTYKRIAASAGEEQAAILIRFSDSLLGLLGFAQKDAPSRDFHLAVRKIESVIDRKLRSVRLLERSGIRF